ncbi:glycoside hydrolase family 127 protein [Phytoactinopolyspora endophytica]|uniref:glycoside hydrolase family 127 protein n=1 Tax=Phytoactinopolyspora endophytica TaxID=1642495 RepID=UPI00101C9BF2|nr:beta-L-arabinofuranosidase domain-containing protein [Phytoactinopolyspora endophytica]
MIPSDSHQLRRSTRAPAVRGSTQTGSTLGPREVDIVGGLLAHWQERNRSATLPHAVLQVTQAGNLENLRRLLDGGRQPYQGRYPFLDTDVYKTLEGLAYEAARGGAVPAAEDFYDDSVKLIERVQADDGYIGTYFQDPDAPKAPWEDMAWGHELYNLGHLTQAAVAASRQLGDDRLLNVARRFADLTVARFGDQGEPLYCGHPEIEMALVELYRETGERSYLRQAELFVERRGAGELRNPVFPLSYFQDEVPLRRLTSVTGHAVRMTYLAAGATDVCIETGDAELLAHLEALWDDMVATKLYLTGGLGSRHSDEAIGDRYELPPERAYAETCAAIGTMQWGWRLFLATGRADVLDVVERVLYNAYAVGTSLDGRAFFYDNPLQRRPDHDQRSGAESGGQLLRRSWFRCACCPPNVARWTAQLQDHVALASEDGLTIAMYASARIRTNTLDVTVRTDYPWDGRVTVHVDAAGDRPVALTLRVPAWATGASVRINDEEPIPAGSGWLRLDRSWAIGDSVVLDLPMRVRAVRSHPHLDATRGAAAVLRGPLVYCVEQQDSQAPVDDLVLSAQDLSSFSDALDESGWGMPVRVLRAELAVAPGERDHLYPEFDQDAPDPTAKGRAPVRFVPYFLWGNREAGAMRVWLRQF